MRHPALLAGLLLAGAALLPQAAAAGNTAPRDALVKASGPAVYYHAGDGKRYVFPNQKTYATWFSDFGGVVEISDAELAAIPLGGNVTYRPGIRMVKIQSDPKVYAVARGGELRWVTTETVAEQLYGPDWNQQIDDVSDAYFVNYHLGQPIESPLDFAVVDEAAAAATINADRGLPVAATPKPADTAPTNQYDDWRQFAFEHINQLRAENGSPPLVLNDLLNVIAFHHSKDMARNIGEMSHDGSNGEEAHDRIKQGQVPDFDEGGLTTVPFPAGIGWSGENVGRRDVDYFAGAEEAIVHQHEWFMDEPEDEYNHRTTMLSTLAPFSQVGIGLYLDADNVLWITEDYISVQ